MAKRSMCARNFPSQVEREISCAVERNPNRDVRSESSQAGAVQLMSVTPFNDVAVEGKAAG